MIFMIFITVFVSSLDSRCLVPKNILQQSTAIVTCKCNILKLKWELFKTHCVNHQMVMLYVGQVTIINYVCVCVWGRWNGSRTMLPSLRSTNMIMTTWKTNATSVQAHRYIYFLSIIWIWVRLSRCCSVSWFWAGSDVNSTSDIFHVMPLPSWSFYPCTNLYCLLTEVKGVNNLTNVVM